MASTRSPGKRTMLNEPLISARGSVGRVGYAHLRDDIPERDRARDLPDELCREALDDFPEVSEGEVVRHFNASVPVEYERGNDPLSPRVMHDEVQPRSE